MPTKERRAAERAKAAQDAARQGVPVTATKSVAGEIRDKYSRAVDGVRESLHDYWLNHAFLLGSQWLWYSPHSRRLEELPRDPDRVMATINRLWPASRGIIGKMMQRELTFEVMPTGADDATLQAARISESILESIRHAHGWEAKRESASWSVWKGGTAAICVDWDPKADGPVLLDDGQELPNGDTIETVLSIAEIAVQPGVRDAERATWWVKAQVLPPETVKATFGLDKTPAADASAGATPFQQKLMAAHSGSQDTHADLCLVLTYYERPNKNTPKGKVCVVVGDEVVQGPKPWPFPWTDHLNFALVRETPNENHWAGSTVMTMARPVQVAYNASWSAIIEHMKLAGNARFLVPHSAMDLVDQFTDTPGEITPFADGMEKPSYLSPPQMPGWWVEQPGMLAQELDDILGFHDVSRGTSPPNIESGYGLSVLAEQDSTPVGRLVKEIATAFAKVGSMVLKLYEAEVDTTRTANVQAEGLPPETIPWKGSDLAGQTTATVPMDAVLPRSRAGMMAVAEKLAQMGMVTSVEQFTKIAELPGHREIVAAMAPDVARARRENAMMAMGHPAVPYKWDNHKAHIQEHNVFRKSPRYEQLSDELKQVFEEHCMAHETLSAEEMGRQMAKVAVDPALATAADAGEAPTLEAGQLPPEALAASAAGAGDTQGGAAPPEMDPASLAELQGEAGVAAQQAEQQAPPE